MIQAKDCICPIGEGNIRQIMDNLGVGYAWKRWTKSFLVSITI